MTKRTLEEQLIHSGESQALKDVIREQDRKIKRLEFLLGGMMHKHGYGLREICDLLELKKNRTNFALIKDERLV